MKTLTGLSGKQSDDGKLPVPERPAQTRVTQAQPGFWRRIRAAQNGIYLESSTGGSVFIPMDELWTMAEQIDPNLVTPKTI
jgi:hypothetical protein